MRIGQCGSVYKALVLSWCWLFYHGGLRNGQRGSGSVPNGQLGSVYKALHGVGYLMVACQMVSLEVCIRLFMVLVI